MDYDGKLENLKSRAETVNFISKYISIVCELYLIVL